jgi:hypothetical protein
VAGIDRYLAGLQQEARRSGFHLLLFRVIYFGALLGIFALLVVSLGFWAFAVVFLFAVFTWDFQRSRGATHALLLRRVAFLDALLRRLRDDLAPTEKLRVRYHERPLDSSLHEVKSTKSSAGNTKTYHRSRWLRVRGTLADGTRFRMRLQSASKRKKGQTLRAQSALILEVTPPPHRAGAAAGAAGETLPWGAGSVSRKADDTLVFRFLTSESDMIEQTYRALRYSVALHPAAPGPASPG